MSLINFFFAVLADKANNLALPAFQLYCCNFKATTVLLKIGGAFHYAKDSGNLGRESMERSISVPSDHNIWDHLWRWSTNFIWTCPTKICCSIFDKPVHCPASLHFCREFGKGIKNGKSHSSWLAWFDRKMSFHFPRVLAHGSNPHVINTILGHYARFWIFWRESFEPRKKRLATRGSRLGLAGSQNSLPRTVGRAVDKLLQR